MKAQKIGRPRLGRPRLGHKQLSLRMTPQLIAKLARVAKAEGISKSRLVARWIKGTVPIEETPPAKPSLIPEEALVSNLSARQVARHYGLNVRTIYRNVRAGKLAALFLGPRLM